MQPADVDGSQSAIDEFRIPATVDFLHHQERRYSNS
jgi:hypothetical protein